MKTGKKISQLKKLPPIKEKYFLLLNDNVIGWLTTSAAVYIVHKL